MSVNDDDHVEHTDPVEVDPETATAFWAAVIYVNAGILLIALGPTVYALRGHALVAATLVAGGVVALFRANSVYRSFEAETVTSDDEIGDSTSTDEGPIDD